MTKETTNTEISQDEEIEMADVLEEPKAPKLTMKQEKFANAYLETGNATEAVRRAGYDVGSDNMASVIGSKNIRNDKVMDFLRSKAEECANNIYILAQSAENENVRLSANKDIMDRSGFKPTDKIDMTTGGDKITNDDIVGSLEKLLTNYEIHPSSIDRSDGESTDSMDSVSQS